MGRVLTDHDDIEAEILRFYRDLVGTSAFNLQGVNIPYLRKGKQVTRAAGLLLIQNVTEAEIWDALKGIGDTKAPGIDGFNSFFFKSTWHVIKANVIAAVQEFFEEGRMFKAINCTFVMLFPKSPNAQTMREMHPVVRREKRMGETEDVR